MLTEDIDVVYTMCAHREEDPEDAVPHGHITSLVSRSQKTLGPTWHRWPSNIARRILSTAGSIVDTIIFSYRVVSRISILRYRYH